MEDTITATIFDVESEAFQAFSELKLNASDKKCHVSQAALMKKAGEHIDIFESFDNNSDRNSKTLKGTLIGAVAGLIMGPIGILVGGGIGAALALNSNDKDYVDSFSLIESVSSRIMDGETVIIALLEEEDESVFDNLMGGFKTEIMRWDASIIKQEVKDAEELEVDLVHEAQSSLRHDK